MIRYTGGQGLLVHGLVVERGLFPDQTGNPWFGAPSLLGAAIQWMPAGGGRAPNPGSAVQLETELC